MTDLDQAMQRQKLTDKIFEIHAGGQGSGCHGPNCGRPKGHSGPHRPKGRRSNKPAPWAVDPEVLARERELIQKGVLSPQYPIRQPMSVGMAKHAASSKETSNSSRSESNPLDKYFEKYKKGEQYVSKDSAHTQYVGKSGRVTVHEHPGKKKPVTVYYSHNTDRNLTQETKFGKKEAILHLRDQYKIKHKFHLV